MSFLWNALDYIPVVGAVKNAGQAVVALAEGDFRRAASKTVEATVGGALDYMTLGAGKALATAVVKESGKAVTKEIGKVAAKETGKAFTKELTKMAAKKTAVKIVAGSVATATAVRVLRKRERSPSPFRFPGESIDVSSYQQDRSRKRMRSSSRDRTEQPTAGGSGQDPNDNDNNRRVPRRGYHIINDDVLKLFRKILNKFMKKYGFSYLTLANEGAIANGSQIYEDFNNPLSQGIFDVIENELVVRTWEVLNDPNDAVYGDYRQRLEDAFLEYMTAIYDRINDKYDPEYIEDLENNTRNNVISLINDILSGDIFIDQTTLAYWYTEDVNTCFHTDDSRRRQREVRKKKFEDAKRAVEDMLRGMADKAEVWVREFIEAVKKYCNNLNRNN